MSYVTLLSTLNNNYGATGKTSKGTYEIDVGKYVNTHVGGPTLSMIEDIIYLKMEAGYDKVIVNIEGLSINQGFNVKLAELIYDTGCVFKGLDHKTSEVFAYIETGYFIKERLGRKKYTKWFRDQVEESGYPMMIKDNRLEERYIVEYNIILPQYFDKSYFHYHVIKPQYLEPKDLERAILNNEPIYTVETVRVVDIGKKEMGIRFAGNEYERNMLDIFSAILNKEVQGFA